MAVTSFQSGMGRIEIGTCGYRFFDPGEGWQDAYESKLQAYSDAFSVGELNRTFYSLPRVSTAERWRREAVDGFTFTLKAWQGLTHPWRSPTWNDHREAVPDDRTDEVGLLQPTDFVREAWEQTRVIAEALDAAVVVVQTPPSFDCTDEHADNLRRLLGTVERDGFDVAWEPRGDWPDHPDRVAALCDELDLIHVVDVMRDEPRSDHAVAYARLHGLNDDPYDYAYEYEEAELEALADRLDELADGHRRVYCLFNNYEMYPNARSLRSRFED